MTWTGTIQARSGGAHTFSLYASDYHKLYIDDKLVLDGWRQNWNAWYHNFEIDHAAGKPRKIRIEWVPHDGYMALLHNDPLPPRGAAFALVTSELGKAIDYYSIAGANTDEVIAGYRASRARRCCCRSGRTASGRAASDTRRRTKLLGAVKEYRKRQIPLDNIVQDWFYWKEDSWGSHEFDAARYPEPEGDDRRASRAERAIHDVGVAEVLSERRTTRSWMRTGTSIGATSRSRSKDWVGPGYLSSFYDPYSEEARRHVLAADRGELWESSASMPGGWTPPSRTCTPISTSTSSSSRMGPTAMGPGRNTSIVIRS